MYQKGFRPQGEAKHYNTFRFLSQALSDEYKTDIARLQKLRSKRNQAVYRTRGVVSEREAKDIFAFAERFHDDILALMPKHVAAMTQANKEESG